MKVMFIDRYRQEVEKALALFVEELGEKNRLRDACEYALLNQGKRLRPILVLAISDALGRKKDVMAAALSVECFHTASLIADDLPSMDNDEVRRNRPSLHKQFDESTAILASYALIAEGYGGIAKNGVNDPKRALLCLEMVRRLAGINGATNGQHLDLNPPDLSLKTAQKVIYQKTVTLFEISFLLGWIFGGGDLLQLETVKTAAFHLGMAFQIADDLWDKCVDERINMALILGREDARRLFDLHMQNLSRSLTILGLSTDVFEEITSFLVSYKKEADFAAI